MELPDTDEQAMVLLKVDLWKAIRSFEAHSGAQLNRFRLELPSGAVLTYESKEACADAPRLAPSPFEADADADADTGAGAALFGCAAIGLLIVFIVLALIH